MCRGPGSRAVFSTALLSRTREHFDFQIFVKHQLVVGADSLEEIERLGVTTHQDVLAVVDEIASVGILERIRAPAERGFSFEHRDPHAALRERDRGAESREAGADNDRVFRRDAIYPRSELKRPSAHARPTR